MRLSRTLPYRKAAEWQPSTLPLCIFTGQRQLELRKILGFHPTFSRHGIAQILSALGELIWLNEKVGFHPTFSRHGIAQILSALALLIWLNEKVGFHPTFSRHGIAQSLSALALLIWLNEKVASACVVARQPPPPVFRFPISRLIRDGALPPCRRCVVLGRVQRCPRPCATLSTAVINVVHGRGQRTEPVFATDFPLEAMERRVEEADNSVPSSSFGHLRASKGGGGVSICEIMPIFALRHFTQCIE